MRRWLRAACLLAVGAAAPAAARAGNVDLATVPPREGVQLTIYNSEDLTLVRETRRLSFKPGDNALQFSWAGTLIDPTSVELRFRSSADKLELIDTVFPLDRAQVLYWNVASTLDGDALVEISYFTSGISWTADYVCIADADEAAMSIENYVRITNNSGEEYEDAQVRLVVGTINLVEKIAMLAQVPLSEVSRLDANRRNDFRLRAARGIMERASSVPEGDVVGGGAGAFDELKQVYKEGLSEYFIYTIEGTETIPNGWSKRLRSLEAADVPCRVEYRYRPEQYGDQLVRLLLLTNDVASRLGTTPLPDGIAKIFRANERGGLSFVASHALKYVPIGDSIELNLGVDPDVTFELAPLRTFRDNIWLRLHGAETHVRMDDGNLRVDLRASVAGWDEHVVWEQRVRNYRDRPIEIEVRRPFDGDVVFRSALGARRHDYRTIEYRAVAAAGEKLALGYETITRSGRNSQQNEVVLEGMPRP
ncbi:MAG TPA: hypothetical protein PKC49_02185 [Phycisphaerae bacterium]|nr:hypothetical protein [Phycisphaerae bacterium]